MSRKSFEARSFAKIPLNPIDTFVYNPNCESHVILTDVEKQLVIYTRLARRFINDSPCYVVPVKAKPLLARYGDKFAKNFHIELRRQLVEPVGPEYFPAELLGDTLNPGMQSVGASVKLALASRNNGGDEVEENMEVDDTFGDDDYAHEHYEDEDRDDDFLDADTRDRGDEW